MNSENMSVLNPIESENNTRSVAWTKIEPVLQNLQSVMGGYSDAHRGLLTLEDKKSVFVKLGVTELTKKWANKEIRAYDFLARHNYPYAPLLLSANEDNTAFALEALKSEDGWDWSDTWSEQRLRATLEALDTLAHIQSAPEDAELLKPAFSNAGNGWAELLSSEELRSSLTTKLQSTAHPTLAREIETYAERTSGFTFRHDALVHDDVRADNCPWNEKTGELKLVDWNFLELGDRRIDLSAMLVHVQNSGFDVLPNFADRLDADALRWVAGYWLAQGSKPIWLGGHEELRGMQLQSGLTAIRLANEIG